MAGFNPDDYETVKSRKQRFYKDYEDGRIIADCINRNDTIKEYAFFSAILYKSGEEYSKKIPFATGFALEIRGEGFVNKTSWTENCEESAIGRALDNAGYSGNNKCSREEMEKAGRMNTVTTVSKNTPITMGSPPIVVPSIQEELGDYVLQTGNNKGQSLNMAETGNLVTYLLWLDSRETKGKAKQDADAINEYLNG